MGMSDDGLLEDAVVSQSPRPMPRSPVVDEPGLEQSLQAALAASVAEAERLRAALGACEITLQETLERAERAEASLRAAVALHAAEIDVRDAVLLRMRRREAATAVAVAADSDGASPAAALSGTTSPGKGGSEGAVGSPSVGQLRRRAVSVYAVPGGNDATRGAALRGRRHDDAAAASAAAEVSRLESALRARDAEVGRLTAAFATAATAAGDGESTAAGRQRSAVGSPVPSWQGSPARTSALADLRWNSHAAASSPVLSSSPAHATPESLGLKVAALVLWVFVALPLWSVLRLAGLVGLRGLLSAAVAGWAVPLLWGLSPWGRAPPPAFLARGVLEGDRVPPPPLLLMWRSGAGSTAASPRQRTPLEEGREGLRLASPASAASDRRAALAALRAQAAQLMQLVARIDAGQDAGGAMGPLSSPARSASERR